ncbi:MAG: hypothetical protein IJZ66_01375 [Oscillibacter sp.]|nr:hypothetical protein [Oscillibacter sp.]
MCWLPRRGQGILIVKAGDLGEELCCAGAEMEIPEEMEEGELFLQSGGASIFLKNDGRILLEGQVFVNGEAI